jgi:hypothetical protein
MLKFRSPPILAGAAVLGAGALFGSPAAASVADNQDFQIGVCGTPCTLGGDPNPINTANFSISVQGSNSVENPLLILIGEKNPGATAPTLSVPNGVTAASAAKYFGLDTATTGNLTGALQTLTAGNTGTNFTTGVAYDALDLAGGPNSNSFVNWTTTPFPGGAPNPNAGASSFSLYAIAIQETGGFSGVVSGFDLSNVENASFVFAYGCTTVPATITNQCDTTGDNVGATPFTNVGVTPAPVIGHGLFVLLAVGGVLFGGKALERSKKKHLLLGADTPNAAA